MAASYFMSYFIKSLVLLILNYGVLCGLGFSMVYASSVLVPGFYFEKYRGLATSLAVCGAPLALLAFPPIFDILLME